MVSASKRRLGRRIFLCVVCVALAYSVYSTPGTFGRRAGLSAGEPDEAELTGLWVPDEETASRLKGLDVNGTGWSFATRLSLDGSSFEVAQVPYFDRWLGGHVYLASWRGSWCLYREQGRWAAYLPGGPVEVKAFLHGERPRYRLRLVVGDALVNDSLWFVRK